MKKQKLISLILLAPIGLWAQSEQPVIADIDFSDVVVVEGAMVSSEMAESQPDAGVGPDGLIPAVNAEVEQADMAVSEVVIAEVDTIEIVEIPDMPVEGIVVDVDVPEIPDVTTVVLPSETEVVLELPGQGAASSSVVMAKEETISVDFPDEDVRTILRNVADLFDLNVVIPDALQGRTSVKLRNITWRQVFDVVLKQQGYTYVEDRNIIEVVSVDELTAEPVDTRVFIVNYAKAAEIQGSISPLIDPAAGGRIQVDVRSNALVITERPSRMNKIQDIIDRLDRVTDQVMIETKFIEVTNNDQKNIGVNWSSLEGYSAVAGPFNREWTRERSSQDTDSTLSENASALAIPGGFTSNDSSLVSNLSESISGTSRLDTAVFSADQFRVVISALEQANDSKLVANPTVVTMNNQEATIDIVTEIPQVEFTFNAETGSREADGLAEPLVYGTQVIVTPQVNSAGFINLIVSPSVSNAIGVTETEVGPQPIISRRTAQTNVVIKDGYTLAIGGLTQNEEVKGGTSVPILGSLPYIGRLFSSESNTTEQKNLIIFITAKTLNPDGSNYRDIVDPRVLNQMGIVPSEVPGYEMSDEDLSLLKEIEDYRALAKRAKAMEENKSEIQAIEDARKAAAEAAAQESAASAPTSVQVSANN